MQNRLRGFLEARLGDDPELMNDFAVLVEETYNRLGMEPSTVNAPTNVPVIVYGNANIHVQDRPDDRITWAALTTQEAARRLETLERSHAVVELVGMAPASAARRVARVDSATAAELLSRMDEPLAAELLALMEPRQGAAVLELMNPDWVVARLSEMKPDRALVLLGTLGTKRIDDLLTAMERQDAVRLLGSVGKVLVQPGSDSYHL